MESGAPRGRLPGASRSGNTAILPVGSNTDLLVEVSDPGPWMLHCHIAGHLQEGTILVFGVTEPSCARCRGAVSAGAPGDEVGPLGTAPTLQPLAVRPRRTPILSERFDLGLRTRTR